MDLSNIGVIPAKIKQFNSKKIYSVEDLLRFLPRKYYDFRNPKRIVDLELNEIEAFIATITEIKKYPKMLRITLKDDYGATMYAVFFQYSYVERLLDIGSKYIFYGKITIPDGFFRKQVINPKFSKDISKYKKIIPIYSAIKGMSDDYLLNKIESGLAATSKSEYLDSDIVKEFNLVRSFEADRILHQPKTMEELERAKERLVFDELFKFSLITDYEYSSADKSCKYKIDKSELFEEFLKTLTFDLTQGENSQEETIKNILSKMKKGERTNSLVQGDVGCGKTIVATILMLTMSENGYQSALMAPTTVLAQQHYNDISKQLAPFGIKCAFLGGKMKAKEKREVLASIKTGEAKIIIGTHAVISKDVEFDKLALTIVDEEHRFGVVQRRLLEKKTSEGVHSIIMSATPIPRSLAITIYGSFMDVYTIKKMPKGRKPVITTIEKDTVKSYNFMLEEIKKGRQCYVVCPLIEESDSERMTDVQSTEEEVREIMDYFKKEPSVRICQINGKMKQEEINKALLDFAAHKYDIIVSTTIIEVGVNVPNSTVMLIKNSERFGLAQLHQLRGRVGRGEHQSYCILQTNKEEVERLIAMTETTDGFKIAEKDLLLRGMGDFIGTKQTGENKAVMLMLAQPDLYNKIKVKTNEIVMSENDLMKYQNIIDDYHKLMKD